jgi:hypothetical protein
MTETTQVWKSVLISYLENCNSFTTGFEEYNIVKERHLQENTKIPTYLPTYLSVCLSVYLSIYLPTRIYLSMALQLFVEPWPLF